MPEKVVCDAIDETTENRKKTFEERFAESEAATVISVNNPTPMPDYTFDSTPTTEELRAAAVRAMYDLVSVKWTPAKTVTYSKEGSVSDKKYLNSVGTVYSGVPYSNGCAGIFQFMKYLNPETGVLDNIDFSRINYLLGGSCSATVTWGWRAVVSDLKKFSSHWMTPKMGVVKVGNYKLCDEISNYKEYTTVKICGENTAEDIFAAYTECLPADMVVSSGEGSKVHAMMVVEKPIIVRTTDGKIDAENSFLVISDQRAGNYPYEIDGQTAHRCGRFGARQSFKTLFEGNYIPVTMPIFKGLVPYEKPYASCDMSAPTDVDATVKSNFGISVVSAKVFKNGSVVKENFYTTSGLDYHEYQHSFPVSELDIDSLLKIGDIDRLTVSVQVTTGRVFTVADFNL